MRRRAIVGLCLVVLGLGPLHTPAVDVLHAGQEPPKAGLLYFAYSVVGHADGLRTANLYLLTGDDHHSPAVLAEDQIILVDTKSTPRWGPSMTRRLASISDEPVITLINTNVHQGGSNAEFPTAVDIIAHENTKRRMASLPGANAAPAKTLPNKTFTDRLSLPVTTIGTEDGSNRLDLCYFGPGYTDGDTVVVFPQYNSVFLGELFPGRAVPLIDRRNGGSALRFPDTLDKAVATLKTYPPLQNVIPVRETPPLVYATSIRPLYKLTDLEQYAAFTRALVDASRAAHDAKKSVDDAVAGFSLPERFKGYALDQLRPFVQAVYDELR